MTVQCELLWDPGNTEDSDFRQRARRCHRDDALSFLRSVSTISRYAGIQKAWYAHETSDRRKCLAAGTKVAAPMCPQGQNASLSQNE